MVSGIIVAAGKGKRMGASFNKVFLKVKGKTILEYTVENFLSCKDIDEIIIVTGENDIKFCKKLFKKYPEIRIVAGGKERKDSVRNGLEAAEGEFVAVHDGARMLITPKLISDVVKMGMEYKAAALGVVSKDTIKLLNIDKTIKSTPNREYTYQIQTPQVFDKELLISAHDNNKAIVVTDDCYLVEQLGKSIIVVDGSYENIKITTPEDLTIAKEILKRRKKERIKKLWKH